MRKLRVVFTTVGGAMPALMVAMVVPAADACGGGPEFSEIDVPPEGGRTLDAAAPDFDVQPPPLPEGPTCPSYVVELPEPGTAADPGQLCAVPSPVASSISARVTFSGFSPQDRAAIGVIEVPAAVEATIVGLPTVTVQRASAPEVEAMTTSEMTKAQGGFRFRVSWPDPIRYWVGVDGTTMTVRTTFTIACADGGTTTVESLTKIDLCQNEADRLEWVSSGDTCTVCHVIAEMAPSPIVSDKRGDDLPLGMVLRLRVVEVARAGRHILLYADNDAGASAEYEWRVSEGTIEHIADDIVLWTLPDEAASPSGTTRAGATTPFGQVAVWNDHGAAVENFVFSVAWQVAA